MKMLIGKCLLALSLSSLAVGAFADWQCSVMDKGGHRWAFSGMTQDRANQVAMSFCTSYSPNSGTCHTTSCNVIN